MLKVIIAEDNPIHMKQISSIIEWDQYDIEIVGQYSNGRKVLENLDTLQPDLIITDIWMPVLTGIQLAESIKKINEEIKIIFISSSDDFTTAKKAINLKVDGYILKPLRADDISDTIYNIVKNLKKEKALSHKIESLYQIEEKSKLLFREQFFREMINGNDLTDTVDTHLHFLNLDYLKAMHLCVASIKLRLDKNDIGISYSVSLKAAEIFENSVHEDFDSFIIKMAMDEYVVILFIKTDNDTLLKKNLLDYFSDRYRDINEHCNIDLTVALSPVSANILDICSLYGKAKDTINNQFLKTEDLILFYDDIINVGFEEKDIDAGKLYDDLNLVLFSDQRVEINRFINTYFEDINIESKYLKEYTKSVLIYITNILETIMNNQNQSFQDIFEDTFVVWRKLADFESIIDVKQWLENILLSVRDSLNSNSSQDDKLIAKIKDIIHKHYSENISINDIGESIFFSARQINYIFKKHTGITVFDYLVNYRMEMAKSLLTSTKMKIGEVAEEVGYSSKNHFRLVFTKYTGLSPIEYKKKHVIEG